MGGAGGDRMLEAGTVLCPRDIRGQSPPAQQGLKICAQLNADFSLRQGVGKYMFGTFFYV